ncbi:GspH/FimT family pseudopilin [Aromatoleum evansii]|uniref:GspH/FimT family pseudopilin n=1 Tax=Aromatoleum evansii TaxID=59406 RepID=UPI00145F6524|nr:prepilin-type N-terminal cleavage/methylation domain-containing protein [Aromatoleum evansii]
MLNFRRCAGRQTGFTLVEALVAVGVLAILASLAAPSFQTTLVNFRVRVAAEGLVSGLQLARAEALRRNQAVRFTLTDGRGNWSVATVSPVSTIQEAKGTSAAGVAVAANASQTNVVFLPSGLVDTAAPRIEDIDLTTRVPGVRNLRVQVHGGGLVQLCDPAATGSDSRKC